MKDVKSAHYIDSMSLESRADVCNIGHTNHCQSHTCFDQDNWMGVFLKHEN